MSQSRCGLQVNRDITITKDIHNWPRKKQLGCLINGSIKQPGESMISTDLADDELENQRELADIEKQDIAELSFDKLTAGLETVLPAEGTIPSLSEFSVGDLRLLEPFIEEGLSRGLSGKQAETRAKRILKKIKEKKGQKGEGFRSNLLKLANILPLRKIGESVAATISNAFPDSDENARNIFPGEHHAVVLLPNGKFGRASYTGPGTRIVERLARGPGGDPPRVLSDKVSQAHDIRYGLADADGVSQAVAEDNVRKADLKMLSSLEDLKRDKLDRNVNIIPAMIGIRGKVLAENFGLLSRSAFIDPNFKPSAHGLTLMKNKLKELEQQGFGLQRSSTRRKIGGPVYLDPQPGTTSTQSLAGIYESDSRRGVALDRRGNVSSFASRLKPMLNTRAEFKNRRSGVSQTGSGQNPGLIAAPSSQMIDIRTSARTSANRVSPAISRGAGMHGGKGQAGVNPIDIQTGSGRRRKIIDLPGTALLRKLGKKVQKRKLHGGRAGKALFMDEHKMSRIMAEKLLPMIMV